MGVTEVPLSPGKLGGMANSGHISPHRREPHVVVESPAGDLRGASRRGMMLKQLATMANMAKVALGLLVAASLFGLWHNLSPDEAITSSWRVFPRQ